MKFDTKLSVNDYLQAVEEIADGFFNEHGEYAPHLGRIVSVAAFCDFCMKESVFPDIENPDMNIVFKNKDIMDAYTDAVIDTCDLTFGAAYSDAMKIVDYRKSSMVQAVNMLTSFINEVMSPDNLSKLYAASERLKEVAKSDGENVVPLFPKKEG